METAVGTSPTALQLELLGYRAAKGYFGSLSIFGKQPGLLEATVQQTLLVRTSFIFFASLRKHESSVIPLLVRSESNPLRWALIRLRLT